MFVWRGAFCTDGVAKKPCHHQHADCNIMDNVAFMNILPFGVCTSLANPAVASATAAALGVLTPMPCTPAIPAPWIPGSPTVLVANMPALNGSSKLMCAYAGVIQILSPGQATIQVP